MGILSSFNIGVTGLKAAGQSMSVVGDNIANAGTHGFKASRPEFEDLLARSLKGIDGGDQIGSGTKLAHVTPMYTQGTITRTENITDLAINGGGFFAIEGNFGRGYTRAGTFRFNKDGELVNGDGYKVIGFTADETGNVTNQSGPIKIGKTTTPAKATDKVKFSMNLDSREKTKVFDPKQPNKTSSFSTSVVVYDSVGTQRMVNLFFNKTADKSWEYHGMVDGGDLAGGKKGELQEVIKGNIVFNDKGVLQQETESQNGINFIGAKPGQKIDLDFGKGIADGGKGEDTITHYGSNSSVARNVQDGYAAASLSSMSFNDEGILTAVYDNGVSMDLAQVAVTKFENNEGLLKMGKNVFKDTKKSGQGVLGKPGFDGRGQILAKSIEHSNVDIADEFINLMNAQRNFQANTKTITTADQMLQEVLGIKR